MALGRGEMTPRVLSSLSPLSLFTHQVRVLRVFTAHVSLQLAEGGEALAAVAGDVGGALAEARSSAWGGGVRLTQARQGGELGEGGAQEAGHT